MKKNKKIALAAVSNNGGVALNHLSDDLKNDTEVVLAVRTLETQAFLMFTRTCLRRAMESTRTVAV